MRRRGFTLIEMLVVVALISILGSLLVIGIGKLQTNSKRQQTRLIFQNLQAMFADYDVSRRIPFGAGNLNPALIPGLSGNLFLSSPGSVTSDNSSSNDRFGYGVQYTRYFMGQLLTNANTAAALGKLPSSAVMTFNGDSAINFNGAWTAGTKYNIASTVSNMTTDPVTGALTTNYYIRTYLYTDPTGVTPGVVGDTTQQSPPNYFYWLPESLPTAPPTPVLLDGWGNPIIFVMGGYLGAPAGAGSGYLYAGSNTTPTNPFQVHSPDYHPFFASAGPDGDFSKGDDNLYSFEK